MLETLKDIVDNTKIILISSYDKYLIKNSSKVLEYAIPYIEKQKLVFTEEFFEQQKNIGIVSQNDMMQAGD